MFSKFKKNKYIILNIRIVTITSAYAQESVIEGVLIFYYTKTSLCVGVRFQKNTAQSEFRLYIANGVKIENTFQAYENTSFSKEN